MIDTIIFNSIFLYWGLGLDFSTFLVITLVSYVGRFFLALLDTPFCYLAVYWIRREISKEKSEETLA